MIGKSNGVGGVSSCIGLGIGGALRVHEAAAGKSEFPLWRVPSMDSNLNSSNSSSPPNLQQNNMPLIQGHQMAAVSAEAAKQQLAELQQQLVQLKHEQQLQQQMLLHNFQMQQRQLAEEHEKQLQDRIRLFLENQKKLEEQKLEAEKRHEMERPDVKEAKESKANHKDAHKETQSNSKPTPPLQRSGSGIASQEVKQKLQEFVLAKKQREAQANGMAKHPWAQRQQMSLDQASPPLNDRGRPGVVVAKNDFPLRKTASEPNLKVRSVLKQKVIDRRSSPLLLRRRGEKMIRRRIPLNLDGQVAYASSDGSPPSAASASLQSSLGSSNGTPISEEMAVGISSMPGGGGIGGVLYQSACSVAMAPSTVHQGLDYGLYSSPSMPNISLGRPTPANPTNSILDGKLLSSMSEAQLRAMAAARLGLPLVSHHVLQPSLPFCSQLPVIDGEVTPPTSPVYGQAQMRNLEQGPSSSGQQIPFDPSQARLQRSILRPLGRTQSAPLPLGHPLLQSATGLTLQQQQQLLEQQQHQLLKQHIRQTVLTRAGSKTNVLGHVPQQSSVVEESEEMNQDDEMEPHQQQKQQPSVIQRQRLYSETSSRQQLRRLSRTLSSPLVSLSSHSQSALDSGPACGSIQQHTSAQSNPQATALVYDSVMLKHQCVCGNFANHPEHAGRLQSIWARLQETGLVGKCTRLRSRKASLEELQMAHSEAYTLLLGTNPLNRQKLEFQKLDLPFKSFLMLSCGGVGVDSDTTWNELHTAGAARMAAGCVIELACKVAAGDVKNGFAVVRPPGHHAEHQQAMGFCFFNSIAVAVKKVQQRFNLDRILIVDWDVHHGNGIQQIFYRDPHVLYVSLHRHDDGNFFPGTGDPHEVGEDAGVGFNVNIAWSGGLSPPMGDAEYLAAFRSIVMPIAKEYQPQMILVACGFDAANGHAAPLGGYQVSPACFGFMTRQLMSISGGKLVLALEGGYDLPSVCDCSEAVTRALLGEEQSCQINETELARKPAATAVETLKRTAVIQAPYWSCTKQWAATIGCSYLEAIQLTKDSEDTVTAMALLSVAR